MIRLLTVALVSLMFSSVSTQGIADGHGKKFTLRSDDGGGVTVIPDPDSPIAQLLGQELADVRFYNRSCLTAAQGLCQQTGAQGCETYTPYYCVSGTFKK